MNLRQLPPTLILLTALLAACRSGRGADPTPTPSATPSPSPTPTATATLTPTATSTPTPQPAARLQHGDRARFYGDWEAALAEYRQASQDSADPQVQSAALLGVAHTYLEAGDHPQALDALRELVATHPQTPQAAEAYFLLGRAYDTLQRYAEAAEAYQRYLELRPGLIDYYAQRWLGDALFNAGDYAAAITAYQAARAAPHLNDDPELDLQIAQAYRAQGEFDTALSLYQDLAGRTSNAFLRARLDLYTGQVLSAKGDLEGAYQAYRHAVENYPRAFESYSALVALVDAGVPVDDLDRGLVDYFAGQYGVAIAAFDRYLANESEAAGVARYYKGLSLKAVGDYAGAIAQWQALIAADPADANAPDAWEQIATVQWAYLNQYPEAAQTLQTFVASNPAHPRAAEFLFDAARILERHGDLEQAAALWERVGVEYPTSDLAYRAFFLSGITQYRLGQYTPANQTFQRALGLASDPGEQAAVHFWVGKAEAMDGETTAARAAWERAALADPTGYYSERARDLLLGREPFEPPLGYDTVVDWERERARAETWMVNTFQIPPDTDFRALGPLEDDPRRLRGAELWRLGMYQQASQEFEDLRRSVQSDPVLTYRLANYYRELGLYRQAILAARRVLDLAGMDDAGTLTAPPYFNYIRFGTYYQELVNPLASAYSFHPLFIYSVMRQESLFEGFISSSAGARGLMQIIPATGQQIHELNGWPAGYTADDLYRPKVSVTFGVDHLYDLREIFDGDLYAALAGYNAGQGNASLWKELAPDDPDLYVEVIRFEETRRYIQRIFEIYSIYRRLYERSP